MRTGWVIIIPAFNEEAVIGQTIEDLRRASPETPIVVGVNGCGDATAQAAAAAGAAVAVTSRRVYGHGCIAAIRLAEILYPQLLGFIFVAADGASPPDELPKLVDHCGTATAIVLGNRTKELANLATMGLGHILANRLFGFWCGLLTGRFFQDLGPLRLMTRRAFHSMDLRELTYGWTIEPQIKAVRLGLEIREVSVRERTRRAGKQKVSRVSLRHSLWVASRILAAGWRSRFVEIPPDLRVADEVTEEFAGPRDP